MSTTRRGPFPLGRLRELPRRFPGRVSPEEEIGLRTLADSLMREYEQSRQPEDLRAAIEHFKTIIRRLPPSSSQRPGCLGSLSYALMSEYGLSQSRYSLEEAIRYGRLARQEAVNTGLLETHSSSYFTILNDLGYALSNRFEASENRNIADIDEAIECSREVISRASTASELRSQGITNLVSRLRLRYSVRGDRADIDEAIQLATNQLSSFPPGTPHLDFAIINLGQIAVERYRHTESDDGLDEVLRQLRGSVNFLPRRHEKLGELRSQISVLYRKRHENTGSFEDIRHAVGYCDLAVTATPAINPTRANYVRELFDLIYDLARATRTVAEVDRVITLGQGRLSEMPAGNTTRIRCLSIFLNILLRKYVLTSALDDLKGAVELNNTLCSEYNASVDHPGLSAPADRSLNDNFRQNLRRLRNASACPAKTRATSKLHELISAACESTDRSNIILLVQRDHGTLLQAYTDAAVAQEPLDQEAIESRANAMDDARQAELATRSTVSRLRLPDYDTGLGMRTLGIDPQTRNIILDLSGFMEATLGFDPTERLTHEQFLEREARLEGESLQNARAEGRHPNTQLCWMCRLVKPIQPSSDRDTFVWKLDHKVMAGVFGTFAQLNTRRHCCICRLILSCITMDGGSNVVHSRFTNIDPEVEGTKLEVGELRTTGEALLTVQFGYRPVGELRLITQDNYRTALRQGWQLADTGLHFPNAIEDRTNPLYTNPLYHTDGQTMNFTQVKQWLNTCDYTHGSICNSFHGNGQRYAADFPLTLIDVVDKCLVEATTAAKYFTLSYVWGRVNMSETKLENLAERKRRGGLQLDVLPATIRDAVSVVQGLGEQFLWVDALCIVQNDQTRKMNYIKRMDIIYTKSFATIVAAHGDSAEAGLPGVRSRTRAVQNLESLTVTSGSENLNFDPQDSNQQTLYMIATPKPLHLALDISTWESRGWILQEQLLSRRCIYFTPDFVYFHCGKEIFCDGGINEPMTLRPLFGDGRPTSEDPLRRATIDNPLANLQHMVDLRPQQRLKKIFIAYTKLVKKYMLRDLSHKEDILNAFSGMFAVLNEYMEGDIINGIPAPVFDLAVLWAPAAKIPRRGCQLPYVNEQGMTDTDFPSWSWAGWAGPVEYRLLEEMLSTEEALPTPLIPSYMIKVDGSVKTIAARTQRNLAIGSAAGNNPQPVNANENLPWPVGPLAANLLRFTAPCVPLSAFTISWTKEPLSRADHTHISTSQFVYHILDRNGKRCGLWWYQAGFNHIHPEMDKFRESKLLLAGVSQHADTYRSRKGPSRVEGEIRIFDYPVYPATGEGSGLINALMIDEDWYHGFAERISVARIHVKAWEEAEPEMRLIQMI